jgi:outer membrane PBP1 activator LpoA protein
MTKAFGDAWINEGGQIIAQVSIDENTVLTDVKAQISAQPADMILIAGNAEEARAIRPHLDAATPTFGFSHIYAGINHEPLDAALIAVRFIDLPWLLNNDDATFAAYQSAAADLPQGEMQRWFALGVDAYQVLLALTQQPRKSATIHGLTGKIRINEKGEIIRELALGRFGADGVVLEKAP